MCKNFKLSFLILISFCFFCCSSDDDSGLNIRILNLSPPDILIGEWVNNEVIPNSDYIDKITFSDSNVFILASNDIGYFITEAGWLSDNEIVDDMPPFNGSEYVIIVGGFFVAFDVLDENTIQFNGNVGNGANFIRQ